MFLLVPKLFIEIVSHNKFSETVSETRRIIQIPNEYQNKV